MGKNGRFCTKKIVTHAHDRLRQNYAYPRVPHNVGRRSEPIFSHHQAFDTLKPCSNRPGQVPCTPCTEVPRSCEKRAHSPPRARAGPETPPNAPTPPTLTRNRAPLPFAPSPSPLPPGRWPPQRRHLQNPRNSPLLPPPRQPSRSRSPAPRSSYAAARAARLRPSSRRSRSRTATSRNACITRETASGRWRNVVLVLRPLWMVSAAASLRRRTRRWMPSLMDAPNDSEW